jgi:hypothetical protein
MILVTLDPLEGESNTFLRNVGNHSPNDTAPYPRRFRYSGTTSVPYRLSVVMLSASVHLFVQVGLGVVARRRQNSCYGMQRNHCVSLIGSDVVT